MNTDNFRKKNMIVNTSAVFLTVIVFYYLSGFLIGKESDVFMALLVALLTSIVYFTAHHLLNRYAKKRHRNMAVNEFL